jgi:PAS domain S-box-containing protein
LTSTNTADKSDFKMIVGTVVLAAVILAFDLSMPLGVAGGVPYVALVLIGSWSEKRWHVHVLASVGSVLTIVGYLASPAGGVSWVVLTNRGLALVVIWLATFLVSSRLKTREALRESEVRWYSVAEQSPDSIALIDPDLKIEYINRTRPGGGVDELIGTSALDHIPEEDREERAESLRRVLDSNEPFARETTYLLPDGSQRHIELNVVPRIVNNKTIGLMTYVHDITERKQREVAQEVALRAKDDFLASMSHELRTPLNAVLGLSEVLQEGVYGSLNERQLGALETIDKSGNHLLSLVNEVLDLSHIAEGRLTLDLSEVPVDELLADVQSMLEPAARANGLELRFNHAPGMALSADTKRIRQVLLNLLGNAVKFTPKGGTVTLDGTNDESGNVVLAVTDTGPGISIENQGLLFKPFVQLDSGLNKMHGGTGLGLALSLKLVELHGGRLELESELGHGSCFTVVLPPAAPAVTTVSQDAV